MKRYNLGLEGPCLELERAVMQECIDGEYVRFEDVESLLKELDQYLQRSIKEEQSNATKGITSSNRVVAALQLVRTRLNSLFSGV